LTLTLSLNNLGKKYNKEWIFRGVTCEIPHNQKLLILGGNGSGKSTLLQVICGFITPNEGELNYTVSEATNSLQKKIEADKLKNYVALASPYLQLVEDFTLAEMIEHSNQFKPFVKNISKENVIDLIQLEKAKHKLIKQFSSGMKQRLKLGLAILSDTPILLLDEPVSNLDKDAIIWYKNLITNYTNHRTVIVCSNAIADEHFFCDAELNVMDYKRTIK
jgi:ABC-type multidrug transport system ATPase subunit